MSTLFIEYFEKFGNLKPKMHLWLHYTRVMLLNGPVIHYSSMKFERKNKKIKRNGGRNYVEYQFASNYRDKTSVAIVLHHRVLLKEYAN